MCWITSAAARAPSRPAFSRPALRTSPNRNPAANRSPAPVVSTIFSIGNAGTAMTPPLEATTQPFSLRVTTPSFASPRNCASAVSKSDVWYSECNSASLANTRSTVPLRIRSRNSPRRSPLSPPPLHPSRHPIRHQQPRHARELAKVRRHQGSTAAAGLGGDQIVKGSDRRAFSLQVGADVASVRGAFRLALKDVDAEAEEPVDRIL